MQKLQKQPKISMISNEVAKAIRGRGKERSKSRQGGGRETLKSDSRSQSQSNLGGQEQRRSQVRFDRVSSQSHHEYGEQSNYKVRMDEGLREKSLERSKSNKINDFLEYNKEWARLRDAKIL